MTARWSLSASRMALAETCSASVVIPGAIDVTPYPHRERGKVLHQYLCDVATLGVEAALGKVSAAYLEEAKAIDVEAMPHADPSAWAVEVAFAYHVEKRVSRELHRGGSRDYSMVLDEELPGTADLVGLTPEAVVVLDVKTGHAPLEQPGEALQLLTLAVAAAKAYGRTKAIVGWIRLWDGLPRFSCAHLDEAALSRAADRVEAVWNGVLLAEIQHASAGPEVLLYTKGDHCRRCPAYDRCPAQVALVREAAGLALGMKDAPISVPKERLGDFYHWVQALRVLVDRCDEYLEARAEEEPITIGPGQLLGISEKTTEHLNPTMAKEVLAEVAPELVPVAVTEEVQVRVTKASLLDAVRKVPGKGKQTARMNALLEVLRERGAVYETTSRKVRAHRAALPAGGES